jgi:hypothetical protein
LAKEIVNNHVQLQTMLCLQYKKCKVVHVVLLK